jgi:ribosomal protein S18 acetylase RimI-like enzyme
VCLFPLQVRELDGKLVSNLREYLELDPVPNVYILVNLLTMNDRSKFFVASTGGDKDEIVGALLVHRGFRKAIGWLVAETQESAAELSSQIDFASGSVWTKPEFEKTLQETTKSPKVPWKIQSRRSFDIMQLCETEPELQIKHEWKLLSESDAGEWARANVMMDFEEDELERTGEVRDELFDRLLHKEPTAEEIDGAKAFLRRSPSFGIFEGKTLVARAAIERLGDAIAIRRVFTNPSFRKKGYGQSITSVAVQEALKEKSSYIILFVRERNYGARRMYERMGFRTVAKRTEFDLEPHE